MVISSPARGCAQNLQIARVLIRTRWESQERLAKIWLESSKQEIALITAFINTL